jgi:hypothetical protein
MPIIKPEKNYEFGLDPSLIKKNQVFKYCVLSGGLIYEIALSALSVPLLILASPFTATIAVAVIGIVVLAVMVFVIKVLLHSSRNLNNDKIFEEFKKEHSNIPEKEQVLLILESGYDHNHAFSADDRKIFNDVKNYKNYKIIFKKIYSNDDISKNIDDVVNNNNTITTLWIRAHGSPRGIRLSPNEMFNCENLKQSFKKLHKKAFIVLNSCSTGDQTKNQNEKNIAQKIADANPGRTVLAPSSTTYANCYVLSDDPKQFIKIVVGGRDVTQKFKTKIRNNKKDDCIIV